MPRETTSYHVACAFALAACACTFDRGGSGIGGGGDASADGNRDIDASVECPAPLHLEISVDGFTAPAGPAMPYTTVFMGDTVALSAAGSCVERGPIEYEWQISPIDATRDSALPDLASRDISVFSIVPNRSYTVRLTIRDADGQSTTDLIFAFSTVGFELLNRPDGNLDVDGLATGGGALWVGGRDGAFRYDPAADAFDNLNTWTFDADTFDRDLEHVYYDPDAGYAWIAARGSKAGVWRANPLDETIAFFRYDTATVLGASTEVNDIGPAHPGVRVATDLGVTTAADSATFNGTVVPPPVVVEALGNNATSEWMGGRALWDLSAPWVELDPFLVGVDTDAKINAVAGGLGDQELWVASDDFGVARVDSAGGETVALYSLDTGDLETDKVRDIAVEPDSGDVWVATERGAARFKQDRLVWVTMGATEGLADRIDLRAIAADTEPRAIYAGGSKGLVYIRVP